MGEPVELTASIVEIAILACRSSNSLYELIDRIREAPKALKDLNADLLSFQQLLGSLEEEIRGTPDASLSDQFKQRLEEIKPTLEECSKACGEFKAKLSRITSNSNKDHTSVSDKVKLQFKEKEIIAFRSKLAGYNTTLNMALAFAPSYEFTESMDC
jgi:Fungal N-terminal domain of STAND proteins